MILIGAAGSGINQRTGENIKLIEIDMENIEAANIAAAKTSVDDNYALLYVNAAVGIRKSECDLFFVLKKYFEKIAVIYDRVEVIDGVDIEILRDDTCAKFDLKADNVLFIGKNDIIDAAVEQKVKYRLCSDIAGKVDNALNNNHVETVNSNNECCCGENKNVIFVIALVGLVVILFFMLFKSSSKSRRGSSNYGFLMNNFIAPAGIFAFVLMLMRNPRIKEFIKNIY